MFRRLSPLKCLCAHPGDPPGAFEGEAVVYTDENAAPLAYGDSILLDPHENPLCENS